MSAEEKRKALEALLSCLATPDIGDLVDEIADAELVRAYAAFLARLSAMKGGHG